jgi:lipopolysaccharide export system protein LptA
MYVAQPKIAATILTSFGLFLFAFSPYLFALPEDSKQPLLVRADSVDLNQKQHLGTYIGNVAVDQGSTHIRAIKAVTESDAQSHLIKAIIEGDSTMQAHYWTIQNQAKPELHAYADTIFYYPKEHQIVLAGHAFVVQDQNKISASTIRYNTETQQVMTSFKGEQTTISIQPNEKRL